MVKQLPIYKIKGNRNIKNPHDRLNFNDVSLDDLE